MARINIGFLCGKHSCLQSAKYRTLKHRGTEEAENSENQFSEQNFTKPPVTPLLRVSKVFLVLNQFQQYAPGAGRMHKHISMTAGAHFDLLRNKPYAAGFQRLHAAAN